ncbi:hypothetical protein HZZ02_24070 [Streptococcus danieliae]|nr:hypothetical protein [Streptococcus danieliae]
MYPVIGRLRKKLSDVGFKRLVGVERITFEKMLEILTVTYQARHYNPNYSYLKQLRVNS